MEITFKNKSYTRKEQKRVIRVNISTLNKRERTFSKKLTNNRCTRHSERTRGRPTTRINTTENFLYTYKTIRRSLLKPIGKLESSRDCEIRNSRRYLAPAKSADERRAIVSEKALQALKNILCLYKFKFLREKGGEFIRSVLNLARWRILKIKYGAKLGLSEMTQYVPHLREFASCRLPKIYFLILKC